MRAKAKVYSDPKGKITTEPVEQYLRKLKEEIAIFTKENEQALDEFGRYFIETVRAFNNSGIVDESCVDFASPIFKVGGKDHPIYGELVFSAKLRGVNNENIQYTLELIADPFDKNHRIVETIISGNEKRTYAWFPSGYCYEAREGTTSKIYFEERDGKVHIKPSSILKQ